ncbi:MAG: hypothetical protein AAGB12_08690 [Pseudomonadota bacterium]
MLFMIKVLAIQLAWFASIAVYLTSQQQVYLKKPLTKAVAWSVFTGLSLVAFIMLLTFYHWLAASLFLLMVWMLGWTVLALWSPHANNPKRVVSVISIIMISITLLGGVYVV